MAITVINDWTAMIYEPLTLAIPVSKQERQRCVAISFCTCVAMPWHKSYDTSKWFGFLCLYEALPRFHHNSQSPCRVCAKPKDIVLTCSVWSETAKRGRKTAKASRGRSCNCADFWSMSVSWHHNATSAPKEKKSLGMSQSQRHR